MKQFSNLSSFYFLSTICSVTFTLLGITAESTLAQAIETEPNDTFTTRQILPDGITTVDGQLEELELDYSFSDSLTAGEVDSFDIDGLEASTPFFAWTDNSDSEVDTILGAFDESNELIDFNDDGGLVGGVASGLSGNVNSDGTINLGVTGFADFGFEGNHSQSGDYDLFVDLDPFGFGDVDFFQFSNLTPGDTLAAEVTFGEFDSVLGLFANDGSLIESDDDDGNGLLSRINTVVPDSGTLNFAVSAFADFGFEGEHFESGEYTLSLTPVPEPTSVLSFLAFVGLGAVSSFTQKLKSKNQ